MSFTEMSFTPERNQLLRGLLPSELKYLGPHLQRVTLPLGKVICEPGERLTCGYLPTGSVVSLFCIMENGTTAEMGIVGDDGIVGLPILLSGGSSWGRAVVVVAGGALVVPAQVLREQFATSPDFRTVLLQYTQALLTQVSQTAACNRLHSTEQRLCRWLLLCHDRTQSTELLMTQELIANVLGGRRESVTVAAGHLQDLRLIRYRRGHITILSRSGLESTSCECYRAVEHEFDRLHRTKRMCQISNSRDAFEAAG
jgi:CRP-like cAMP-binding protein